MQTGVGWCEASRWPCVPGAVPSALRGPHQSGCATARCRLAPRAAAGWAPPPQSQAAGRGAKHRHLRGFRKEKKREKNTHTHTQNSHINSFPSFSFSAFFFLVKPLFHPSWHITYRLRKSQSHTAVRPEIPHLGLQMRQELGLTSVAAGDARPGHLLCRQHLVSSCVSISKYLDNVRSVQLIF